MTKAAVKGTIATTGYSLVAQQTAQALQAVGDPIGFSKAMGPSYAAMMGVSDPAQGEAIALTGYCEGLTPLQFKKRFHWMPGKGPTMQASAMLAEFRLNWGGDYEIIADDHSLCHIKFTDANNREYDRRMTRLDLMLSRNPWSKDPGWKVMVPKVEELAKNNMPDEEIYEQVRSALGDNYATNFDWANMLMARLTTTVLRRICPELAAGVYSPEELESADNIAPVLASETVATAASFVAQAKEEEAEDVPFETVPQAAAAAVVDAAKTQPLAEDAPHPNTVLAKEVEGLIFELFEKKVAAEKIVGLTVGVDCLGDLPIERLEGVQDKLLSYRRDTAKN
jgi:hypothetical protein